MTGTDRQKDNSDTEDMFPEINSNSDELNLSITSTELYNDVGHFVDYQNISDEDDEPLIIQKTAEKEASRTEIDNEF